MGWMSQGLVTRKAAIRIGREWAKLGHSVRIIKQNRSKLVHLYLKIERRS